MKTVLLSAYACLPNHGSEEGNGWHSAILLSENGFSIHCLTKQQGRAAIEPVLDGDTFPNLTMHYVDLPNWVEAFCHKGLVGMYFHYLYWQWQAYQLARRLNQVHAFDMVHHITYGSIQLGSFMYKLGIPFIFGPVGGGQRAPRGFKRYFGAYWSREWMRDGMSTVLQYLNPGFYRSVKQADRVIVTNLDTFALARKLRPKRPIDRVWDGGLSAAFIPAHPSQRQPTPAEPLKLLWVGRLLPRKALELTIQALSRVSPAVPVTLTIVGGKGEMAEHVPHYIEQYGVADRVNWVGHVSYTEVTRFYAESEVFFFTSLRDSCPHQLLEAMAYSLPVITLNLHGQAELVSDETGIRVPVENEEQVVTELARAVEWMYEHPDERLAMGRAGCTFAQSQEWSVKIRTFIDELYPAVLQTASQSATPTEVS